MARIRVRQFLLVALILGLFLGGLYAFWLVPRYTVPILTYHNIGYGKGGFFVTPENFAKQMEYIKKNGYEVITFDELTGSILDKRKLKRNKVVITFDDGYEDNFKYAYPVLREFDFPATIFLITNLVGEKTKIKQFMNWKEIIAMSKNKITFGGHTKSHCYLGSITDEISAFEELTGSKKAIEKKIGLPVDYFCYPGGGFCERAKLLVVKAGYKAACTTNRGFADFNSDVYELKRIKVTNADSAYPFSFWSKLSGYYNILRKKKSPY